MESRAKDLIIQNIPLLKELVEKFVPYQVVKIDLPRIIYFISQFDAYERIEFIIKLVNSIDFIDSNRMTFLLKKAYEKIPSNLRTKPIISSLGSIQDSSAVVCYQLLKQLFDKEEEALNLIAEVNSIGKYIETSNPSSIIFFDDNITSGTQLTDFFEELINGKEKAELVKKPLSASEYETLKKIPIRVCYAIQLAEESNNLVNAIRTKYGLDLEIHTGKIDFNNYLDFQSNTIKSEEESKFARDFIREISEPLYQDKNWTAEIVYHRLLGYGNLGKLTVFYYNVPKSLIPVFWKYGRYKDKPWIPLFPETQEQKKIIGNKVEFEYFQLDAIKNWIDSVPQNRKPNITFGFNTNEGIVQEITIEIPSMNFIKAYLNKHLINKKHQYETNKKQINLRDINSMITNIYPTVSEGLNERDYQNYRVAVDKYNEDIENYYLLVRDYILRQSSNKDVILHIVNNGNIAATNCTVKLIYNSGELLIDEFYYLKKPAFEGEKPIMKYFDSSNNYARVIGIPMEMELLSIMNRNEREPIMENTNYEYKLFTNTRIGHNNSEDKKIEITRMNLGNSYFEIPYEINFDEEASTIEDTLKIHYKETEEINEKLNGVISKSINKLKLK